MIGDGYTKKDAIRRLFWYSRRRELISLRQWLAAKKAGR